MRKASRVILPLLALGLLSYWAIAQETILPRPAGGGSTSTNGLATTNYVNSAIPTNILGDHILYVDTVSGNDTTGRKGDVTKPFLTFLGAATAATSTTLDWAYLRGGTYNETIFSGNMAGVVCAPGVRLYNASAAGITKNSDGLSFTVLGNPVVRAGGAGIVRSLADTAGTLIVEAQEITGTNGGFSVAIYGAGSNFITSRDVLTGGVLLGPDTSSENPFTDVKVRTMVVNAPGSVARNPTATFGGGFSVQGSNSSLVLNVPYIRSKNAGVALTVGATVIGYGDIISETDAISARTNCTVRWHGDLGSTTDASLFTQGGGDIEIFGNINNRSITGNYQLAGSGSGVFCGASGGAKIRVYGSVAGIMPIICENGNVEVYGAVTVTNNSAPVYLDYIGETLYTTAAFKPSDLQTNCLNAAINLIGSGKVLVRGDIFTPSNCAIRMSRTATGIVEVHDSTIQSTDGTRNTSLVLLDGGTLRFSNVRLLAGTSFTNSISATNGNKLVEIYATSAADRPFNANAFLTNGMIQISNILYTAQPVSIDGSDFGTVPSLQVLGRINQATNLLAWGVTNGSGAPVWLGYIQGNGTIVSSLINAATNLANYSTTNNSTNQFTTGVLYTNAAQRSLLTGAAVLNGAASGSANITLRYTNNGVGYFIPMQTGAGVATTDMLPFFAPLNPNATFTFVSTMGTGATGSLTNVVQWGE